MVLACIVGVDLNFAQFKLDLYKVTNHLQSHSQTSRSRGRVTENEIHEKIK